MKQERILGNHMELVFPSYSCNEAFARAAVGAFAALMDPTMEELDDIKTAVSEAVTNCIVHGYPDHVGNISLQCAVYDDNTLEITIRDDGVGIADVKAARTPLFTTGGAERSGMGFTIMERFMSRLSVVSEPDKGTTVTMARRLHTGGRPS